MKFIELQTLFSIFLFFVVYFLTIGPILLIIIYIHVIGLHSCVTNIDFHKHLPYLICAKYYITIKFFYLQIYSQSSYFELNILSIEMHIS